VKSRWRILAALALVSTLPMSWPVAAEPPAEDQGLTTQAFVIHHKDPDDVVALIRPALSEDAAILIQSRIRTLSVTDHQPNLDAVDALIRSFDLPPRDVSMTINLLRASRDLKGSKARVLPGQLPLSLREVTNWLDYELLGGMTIQISESEESTLRLGDEYRVRFQVNLVDDRNERIRLKSFVLERRVAEALGGESYVSLFDTVVNLKSGTPYVFGATRGKGAQRAIFLTITARIAP